MLWPVFAVLWCRFIGFYTIGIEEHNEAVRRAWYNLHANIIPHLARELGSKRHPLFDSVGLVQLIHARGLNVRKLGALRSYLPESSPVARLILLEMCARVVKNLVRGLMRRHRAGALPCVALTVMVSMSMDC